MNPTITLGQLTTQDVATLRSCIEEWVRTCREANWDKLALLLADDVVFLPPDQPIVQGKKSVRAWLDTFPLIRAFDATMEDAEGRADFACVRGTVDMTVEPSPEQPVQLKGKWTAVWRKQSTGDWLCALDIWNTDHPA